MANKQNGQAMKNLYVPWNLTRPISRFSDKPFRVRSKSVLLFHDVMMKSWWLYHTLSLVWIRWSVVMSIFACLPLNSFVCYSRRVWLINLNSLNFCWRGLMMLSYHFGENQTRSSKKKKKVGFSENGKMAENLAGRKLKAVQFSPYGWKVLA